MKVRNYEDILAAASHIRIIQAQLDELLPLEDATWIFWRGVLTLSTHYQYGFGDISVKVDNEEEAETAVSRVMAEFDQKKEDWVQRGAESEALLQRIREEDEEYAYYPIRLSGIMGNHIINGKKQRPTCTGVQVIMDTNDWGLYHHVLDADTTLYRFEASLSTGCAYFRNTEAAFSFARKLRGMCEEVVCCECDGNWTCSCLGEGCGDCEGEPVCLYCEKGKSYYWKEAQ